METVKVDIQKLQLLNDRIAQTIEALNQVRMSVQVQGIQHSPYGFAPTYGAFAQTPFVQSSFSPFTPYAFSPYGSPQYMTPQFQSPQYLGIQHTSPVVPTWTTPWTSGWTTPWQGNGISHSSWDRSWQRPLAMW